MSQIMGTAEYSIAAVSKLTGVSCHALRVWERRYGFPIPERSASGHRRYGHQQVGVLRVLAKLTRGGRPIGELIGEYQSGRLDLRVAVGAKAEEKSVSANLVDLLFSGDTLEADRLLDRQHQRLSPVELIERLIEPAMVDVGERWFRGECEVFQERCATSILLIRLARLLDQARRTNGTPKQTVLVGTVKGDRHEGGVLMVSLMLELAGWRAIPMGVDLPVSEYAKAVESWHPDALGLSFVLSRNINKRFQELSKISGLPIFVGGRSIVNHQGLARRHGLIPLTGTLANSSTQLFSEFEEWRRKQVRPVLG
jgi:MerR family transcriptional regulator, light-induced transcriptional regulator